MIQRNEKVANMIKELAAQFLGRENNRTSLITITGCSASPDLRRATIYMTVLPVDKEEEALGYVKRKRSEIRGYLKKNIQIKTIPFLDIAIDRGEKNRQKIDELLLEK
jgi:ribosome-binding factor A